MIVKDKCIFLCRCNVRLASLFSLAYWPETRYDNGATVKCVRLYGPTAELRDKTVSQKIVHLEFDNVVNVMKRHLISCKQVVMGNVLTIAYSSYQRHLANVTTTKLGPVAELRREAHVQFCS